jgi:hypothetical protein
MNNEDINKKINKNNFFILKIDESFLKKKNKKEMPKKWTIKL